MAAHTVIWKDPRTAAGHPLSGWQLYDWLAHKQVFQRRGLPGQLAVLARTALDGAIASGRNVSIAQQAEDPEADPAALLTALFRLRPATLVCPERPANALSQRRWVIANLMGHQQQPTPQTIAELLAQDAVDRLGREYFPTYNQIPSFYVVPNLILRHDHSAEELGLVEPEPITPNAILNSVANDPAVRDAARRWDRTAPSTHRDLVRARDEAQARMGIPEADRVYLYSSEVESYLMPITMRMGRGDEAATIQRLRREFRVLYGDYAERVLAFCLRNYHHAHGEGLRRAAEAA